MLKFIARRLGVRIVVISSWSALRCLSHGHRGIHRHFLLPPWNMLLLLRRNYLLRPLATFLDETTVEHQNLCCLIVVRVSSPVFTARWPFAPGIVASLGTIVVIRRRRLSSRRLLDMVGTMMQLFLQLVAACPVSPPELCVPPLDVTSLLLMHRASAQLF